jgi:carbonic anhydrase
MTTFKKRTSTILRALLPKSLALYTFNTNNNYKLCYNAVMFFVANKSNNIMVV